MNNNTNNTNNTNDPLAKLLNPEIKSGDSPIVMAIGESIGTKGRKKMDLVWAAPLTETFTIKDLLAANPTISNTSVLISRFREQIGTLFTQVGQVAKPAGTKGRREAIYAKIKKD